MAKIPTSHKKLMSLNPFPVTDLRPAVELMHYCAFADVIVMFETWHWTDCKFT